MKARIRFTDGPLSGQMIELAGERFVIGRGPKCDLKVPSPIMGRRHCMLLLDGSAIRIRDVGSRSGTFVNAQPIRKNEIVLQDGDVITVAAMSFVIEIEGHAGWPLL